MISQDLLKLCSQPVNQNMQHSRERSVEKTKVELRCLDCVHSTQKIPLFHTHPGCSSYNRAKNPKWPKPKTRASV